MMAVDYVKCPWPWFGGKADAAPAVWAALGDVDHYKAGFLKGGMGNTSKQDGDEDGTTHQQGRERLWLSPHCLGAVQVAQVGLFGGR